MEKRVVVFGSSRLQEGTDGWAMAEAAGALLGERRVTVISGGYDGAMGAVSRGARSQGGRVVGITTSIFTDRSANEQLHEERVEPDYPSRLAALLRAGDGFLALPGGLGTLSEWTTAWTLSTIGQLGGPLWIFRDPWGPIIEQTLALPEVAGTHAAHLQIVDDLEELATDLDRWLS